MSDYARSVQILVEIAGNPEAKLDAINKKVDQLAGKQISAGGQQAVSQMSALAASTDKVSNATSSMSSRLQSAFSGIRSSVTELQGSIQNMATSLAGITIGGAVSGLAWLDKAKSNLYNEQIEKSVNANKKLGVSFDMLRAKAKEKADFGEDTTMGAQKELYSIMTMGQKYVGKGDKALNNAAAIGDFFMSRKESLEEQGISSPEALVQRAIRTEGKMSGRYGTAFAMALGVSLDDPSMKSAKSRMKLFMEEGSKVNMRLELDKRPWVEADVNIRKLKSAIGDSIAIPMAFVTKLFSGFVELITKIPGGSALIGYAGMFLALASAASLTIGVMTPLYGVMKAINIATGASAALKWLVTGANAAQATSQELLTISMGSTVAMEELDLALQNTTIASRLRMVAVLVYQSVATTVAAGAMGLLAIATNLAAAPMWLLVGAGLVFVGVLAAIANKAGILAPLLKGISNIDLGSVFGKAFTLDFKGAWGDIKNAFSDIEFPSIQTAFENIFGGTSIVVALNKVFGIPLSSMTRWIEKVHDILNKIREFIENLVGIFNTYVYKPLKTIIEFVKQLIEKIFGKDKDELSKENLAAFYKYAGSEANKNDKGELIGGDLAKQRAYTDIAYKEALGKKLVAGEERLKANTDKKLYEDLVGAAKTFANPSGIKQSIAKAGDWAYNQAKKLASESDQSFDTDKSIASASDTTAYDNAMGSLGSMASGGLIKRSGLVIAHSGEPIIPAEIASSSRLQEILGSIASGKGNFAGQNIEINMTYSTPTNGNGIYLDKFSFERAVNDIIGKALRHYGSY